MADNNNPIKYSDLIKPDNSINDLIDQLEELKGVYESALAKVKKEAEQLSNSLKKVSGATKEGRETIRRASEDAERLSNSQYELTKSLNATTKELNLLKSVQQQQASISKSAENSNKSLGASYESLNSDTNKLTRSIDELYTALSDVEKTNYDAFIKRSENGMVSYSDVMNKASSNVSRLTSISDQLNASFDSGNLSIEDYRAAMERVNAGLQKADSVMNQFQESQKGVDDENGRLQESFYGLDTNMQNLFKNLIELQQEQVNTKSSLKELNKEYDSGKISENEFIERAAALTSVMDGQKDAIKKTQTQIKLLNQLNTSTAGSYEHLSAQYSLNKIRLNAMTKEERENTKEGRELVKTTRDIYEEMKKLQEATGKNQLNVGNYKETSDAILSYADRLKEALGLNNAFGESLVALGNGGKEGKEALSAIGDGAKALGRTLLGLLSNPVFLSIAGLAGAGIAFKWWYDYNTGLIEATRLTQQFTGKEGDDLKAYRNQVQAVADTFNQDFKSVLISSNALSKQFGIDATEALTLIQDGFISGADVTGEFLDNVKEYPTFFKEAGVSADQFIAIVSQTNKAGLFSDKGIDAIKEANIRLREMTPATVSALEGIGISAEQVQKDLQSGTMTTFQVMQKISAKLNELPDSATQVGTAIADIFGGAGEDAGLQYLRTLKDITLDLDTVKEETGVLGALQEEQLRSQAELNNTVAALFDATGGTFEEMITNGKIFVNDTINSMIKGIISFTNHVIELYNESISIRGLWESIFFLLKTGFDIVGNSIHLLTGNIKATGKVLKAAFTLDWDEFKDGLSEAGRAWKDFAVNMGNDVWDNLKNGYENINKGIKPITIPVNVTEGTSTQSGSQITTDNPKPDPNAEKERLKRLEAEKKRLEEVYKTNLNLKRKYEDEELKLETDSFARQRQQIVYNYTRQKEDLRHKLVADKTLNAEGRQAINDTIAALDAQLTAELVKQDQERNLRELEIQKQGIQLRLEAIEEGSQEEIDLRKQLLEKQRQIELAQNGQLAEDVRQSEADINAKYDNLILQQTTELTKKRELALFDQQQKLEVSEFDLLKTSEEAKTRFRLEQEKARLQKILELNEASGIKLSDMEVQTIKNTIARINNEITGIEKGERTKDIYSMIGLNLDNDQKEAINTSVQYAISSITSIMDAKVQAAERAVEAADREVEAAQNALDAEREARANGYANNVEQAQKELDLAKKNQEKALKEQAKAQKQQEAINSLVQASSLVTASAEIFKSFAGTGPWGIPAAIAMIATMWSAFAAAKIKASQLTKGNEEKYGEGTVELLQGGSHQSGNDIDLGTKPDGTRRRAEGGEFFAVINKRNSRRFRKVIPDVIKSLNNGTFTDKYLAAYDGVNNISVNFKEKNNDLNDIRNDIREIKNRERTYRDANGDTIITYKNLKRRIRS
jgi:hypothetical protein